MYMFDSRLEGCKRVKEARLRHVLAGVVRFLGGPESLSFRVVRPCVREAFFEREGTGDVSFGGLNPGKTHGSIQGGVALRRVARPH